MKIDNVLIAIFLFVMPVAALATGEAAGKVGYMSGTLIAQRSDGTTKALGTKSDVLPGDMLFTGKQSYVQILMNDGTKMTLRPNSNLRIEDFHFIKEKPEADNLVLRLLRGGFRTVTGLVGKRGNADAYKLHTASATIGIRGTDFTSRLCTTKDCLDDEIEKNKRVNNPPVATEQVVGRVMLVQGELSSKDQSGRTRQLLLGAPIYEGDTLMSGNKSHAVVAFRDESRVSLQESSHFQVEKFKYNQSLAQENAVLRLLKGGVRVVTGLIGRINHDNYQFRVSSATIGIRGTGFDSWCNGPCASGAEDPGATEADPLNGAGVFVWSGEVALVVGCESGANCPAQIVGMDQAAIIARDTGMPVQLRSIPQSIINNSAPRPDKIPLDMNKLFGTGLEAGTPGLYVTVHDGHVIIAQGDQSLELGPSETGFSNASMLIRLASPPSFMSSDLQIDSMGGNPGNSNPSMNPGGCAVH